MWITDRFGKNDHGRFMEKNSQSDKTGEHMMISRDVQGKEKTGCQRKRKDIHILKETACLMLINIFLNSAL